MSANACPERSHWAMLLEDDADASEADWRRHLEECPRCKLVLQELAGNQETWATTIERLRETTDDAAESALSTILNELKRGPEEGLLESVTLPDGFLQPAGDRLGSVDGFEVHEILGQGGTSVVLKAWDARLNRWVALKVLAPALARQANARTRFIREGRAVAGIEHENVIAVHGVHETAGLPYLVLQYVRGETLQQRLERGAFTLAEIVDIGIGVAQGLAAAHAHGVVHRDIKPANILLQTTDAGKVVVKISDFGLARNVDDVGCTQQGTVVGTPLYMAPEQARGENVDACADLFSLGAVLYTLAAGRPPFVADTALGTLKALAEQTPAPLPTVVPELFQRFILRLLEKRAARRFASAVEVAQWLKQYQAHRETGATPPTLARLRRRRWLIAASLLLALCLTLGAAAYLTDRSALRPPEKPAEILESNPRSFLGHQGPVHSLAVTPDSKHLLSASGWPKGDGTIRLWHLPSGKQVQEWSGLGNIAIVALAPDGKRFLSAGLDGTVRLWEIGNPKELGRFDRHSGEVHHVAWSADGKSALSCGMDRIVRWWNVEGFQERLQFHGHTKPVRVVTISADGSKVLSGGRDETVRWWDAATGKELNCFNIGRKWVNWVHLLPDGKRALAATEKVVLLIDLDSGAELREYTGALYGVIYAQVSPNGKYLAAGGYDGCVRLYDFDSAELLHTLGPPAGAQHEFIWTVAFTPDGRHLLAAGGGTNQGKNAVPGQNFAIRVWHVASVLASSKTEQR